MRSPWLQGISRIPEHRVTTFPLAQGDRNPWLPTDKPAKNRGGQALPFSKIQLVI
jgi:hypothetical protein